MEIQVWADFHCPYCYIGKARFMKALEQLGRDTQVAVVPRSFLLNPKKDRPEGLPLAEHVKMDYDRKLEDILKNFRGLDAQGRELGLPMSMDQAHYASMMDAHRLMQYARTRDLGNEFFKAAQEALFARGAILSDRDTLITIARDIGLEEADAAAVLDSDRFRAEVLADDAAARRMNIDYVPYYLTAGGYHFSGDLDMAAYQQHLEQAFR